MNLEEAGGIERAHAAAARPASEDCVRALVRSLPAAVYTCDLAGRITDFNEFATALWGRTPQLGLDAWCGSAKLYRPDGKTLPLDQSPMALMIRRTRPVAAEELLIERPDGTRRHVMAHPRLIRDPSGAAIGAVNMLVDITDQRRAQQARRHSDDRFRCCFELGLIGMALTSPSKGIRDVNDELCRILGYERDELVRKRWSEVTHPDDLSADVAQYTRTMAGEMDGYVLDKRWIRKDGGVVDSVVGARCVRCADGSVDYFVSLVADVTERKRAEREAIALRNEFATMMRLHDFCTTLLAETDLQPVLEDVLDAIVALQSADAGVLHLYDSGARRPQLAAQRGFGADVMERVRAIDPDPETPWGRAFRTRRRVIVEDVEADPDRWCDRAMTVTGFRALQSTPLFSRNDEPVGVITTYFRLPHRAADAVLRMTDLYARPAAEMIKSKQQEAALRECQQELQELMTRLVEAQELQSKRLARELHDAFGQQLAAIAVEIARLAAAPVHSTETVRGSLLKLTADIGRLSRDIHLLSHQVHPAILDDLGLPAAIRSECVTFSAHYATRTDFTCDERPFDVPEDVALCLYRVVQESLHNIGKHAAASQVSVRLTRRPGEIVMTIDDDGHGFDAARLKGKRGLGLVSMEERLRIVGGTLSVRSQEGNGTHVEATVPVVP